VREEARAGEEFWTRMRSWEERQRRRAKEEEARKIAEDLMKGERTGMEGIGVGEMIAVGSTVRRGRSRGVSEDA
jgi:LDH2 family malate/lactate/ureidoglycolate dehydrogenase